MGRKHTFNGLTKSTFRPVPICSQVITISSNAALPEHRLCVAQESLVPYSDSWNHPCILKPFPETVNTVSREMQLNLTKQGGSFFFHPRISRHDQLHLKSFLPTVIDYWVISNHCLQGKILQSFLIWWENKKEQIPLKHYWWSSILFQSLLKRKQYKKTAKLSQCGRGTLEIQTHCGRAVLLL